ncbi:MAG: hypothetical protein V4507_15450, partial [Verrucomicrobiota bacterium]
MTHRWSFILFLSFLTIGHSQTIYTWAQRARTPMAAHAVLLRSESLPGNAVYTLIDAVNLWTKENVNELCNRSAVLLSDDYVSRLAQKYGCTDNQGNS